MCADQGCNCVLNMGEWVDGWEGVKNNKRSHPFELFTISIFIFKIRKFFLNCMLYMQKMALLMILVLSHSVKNYVT